MHRRIRAALTAAFAVVATVATATSPAHAGTLNVYSCAGPSGQALSMAPWDTYETFDTNQDDYCTSVSPVNGLGLRAYAEFMGPYMHDAEGGFQFVEPAHLSMSTLAWNGQVWEPSNPENDGAHIFGEIDAVGAGLLFQQAGAAIRDTRTFSVPKTATALRFRLKCRDSYNGCEARGHRIEAYQLRVTLEDTDAPQATSLAGSLTTPGYKSGVVGISASASDRGAGVYRSHLTVDGAYAAARSHVVDSNSGSCAPLSGDPHGFRDAVPCRLSVSDALTLDTTTLSEGTHTVAYVLEDAAGNRTTAATYTLRVNHPDGSVPDTACTDGIDNDGDGRTDLGADAGCVSEGDLSEAESPVSTAAPAISGTPRVGSSLGYTAGSWTDGPGGGGATTVRWQSCRYDGAACVDVPGATGASLTLTDALIGRRVRVVETRTTTEGAEARASEPAAAVTRLDGSLPACADGKDNDGDNLVDHDADLGCSSRTDATEDRSGPDEDADGDGIPNRDDPDDDGDGVPDDRDPWPLDPTSPGGPDGDWDGDGIPNGEDPDDDNDGMPDDRDPAPFNPALPGSAPGTSSGDGAGGGTHTTTIVVERSTESRTTTPGAATNGGNASDTAVVRLTGRRTRTLAHGRRAVIRGRIVDERGRPVTGAALTVEERAHVPGSGPLKGSRFRPVRGAAPLVTDGRGRFRLTAPAGHSRTIRIGYRARTADRDFTSVTDVTLLVRSKARFGVDKRRVRNGQGVRFSGRLRGGHVPRTGVQIVLQAETARGWVAFKTTRAKRSGRFAARYRFRSTTGVRTYRFRARVKGDSGYPWSPSKTRTVRVTVRG